MINENVIQKAINDYEAEINQIKSGFQIKHCFTQGFCMYYMYIKTSYRIKDLTDFIIKYGRFKSLSEYWYPNYDEIGLKALQLRLKRLKLIYKHMAEENRFLKVLYLIKIKLT